MPTRRRLRIGIGQLWQETNTFNPLPTTRDDFERFGVLRDAQLVSRMRQTNELGGFIQALEAWPERPQIVGLVRLPAWPSGPATSDTLAWLCDELGSALRRAGPLDALLLALHGAMVADGVGDVEGLVLRQIRAAVGPDLPLVASLDLHALVTPDMLQAADALVLYHTAPHVDVFETGQRAAAVVRRIVLEQARPVTAWVPIPAVLPPERANTQDPASPAYAIGQRLAQWEAEPAILAAGVATVQPWLDVPALSSAAVVASDGDEPLARRAALELAEAIWTRRADYLPELVGIDEAIDQAQAVDRSGGGLVVLSDAADATTSGAPGDSTWLLAALRPRRWSRGALVTLVAPELVAEAAHHAEGDCWRTCVGGRRDTRFARPLEIDATLVRTFQARFLLSGHLARNLPIDMGPAALIAAGDVRIVATTHPGPHFAPQLFEAAGLDPFAASVLVAKSPCGFREAYQARAARVLVVAAPGCAPSDFWNYAYRHPARPLWPWDDFDWRPRVELFGRGRTRPAREAD